MKYIGRFAPSPTGPLHFGSLVAAVASYCEAKSHQGKWLVRMEDLDKPREITGAADDILKTLITFGFKWDGQILYQSKRDQAYAATLTTLKNKQLVYPCTCTRKEIAEISTRHGIDGTIYPQTCLQHPTKEGAPIAWRIKTKDATIRFDDAIQDGIKQNIMHDVGDFVLKRSDGLFAYQLAVVVDDAEQGITHIVRGADLLDSTPRQIVIQQALNLPTPNYMHIPVATNAAGKKLCKQTHAADLHSQSPSLQLWQALNFLNQAPPTSLQTSELDKLWDWAIAHWSSNNIPKQRAIKV